MSLLEKNITRKGQVDDDNAVKLDAGDNSGEYKVEVIGNSAVYVRESELSHLPELHYLISWKEYLEEENPWEPDSAVQHLGKLISLFYKDHSGKSTATSLTINIAPPIARTTVKPTELLKQKQGRLTECAKKCAKWGNKKEATRRNLSQCASRPRSRWKARSMSPWRRECWGTCMIGSSTPKKLYSILFWPSPSPSKSLLK